MVASIAVVRVQATEGTVGLQEAGPGVGGLRPLDRPLRPAVMGAPGPGRP